MGSRGKWRDDSVSTVFVEEQGFENVLLRYKIRAVLPFVMGPSVLDVGCGVGILTEELARRFDAVVGIDASTAKIEKARQRGAAVSFVAASFERWEPTQSFSTIVTTNVLEHVASPEAFLSKCREILLPRGRLIVTVPNALALHKRLGRAMGLITDFYALTDADREKGHFRIYDRSALETDVTRSGFEVVYSGGILLKPLSHRQMESWDSRVVDALFEVGEELPDYCSSLLLVADRS